MIIEDFDYIGAPGGENSTGVPMCQPGAILAATVENPWIWTTTESAKGIKYDNGLILGEYKNAEFVFFDYGKKESEGKVDYSEINLGILDMMAERFNANKHKYPKGNMKKPIDVNGLLWAAFRHLKKMIKPVENDPEDLKDHLAAVLCNMSMVLDQLELKNNRINKNE